MPAANLSAGDRGTDVSALHKKLQEAGYSIAPSELDAAFFGPTTRKAVLSCQRDNSLERSGAVCPQTARALGLPSVPEAGTVNAVAGSTLIAAPVTLAVEPGTATVPRSARLTLSPNIVSEAARPRLDRRVPAAPDFPPLSETRPQPSRPDGEFVVRGTVRQADSRALAGVMVLAFDQDLPSKKEPRQRLGQAETDGEGRYEIRYTAEQFSRAEKGSADLMVAVVVRDPADPTHVGWKVLAESPTRFQAQREETVDFTIGAETIPVPSEFERLVNELSPIVEEVPFAALQETEEIRDISFLAGETGQDPQRIRFLVIAHQMLTRTDLEAEVFYGLFRQDLPTDLSALLAQGKESWKSALERSFTENIIPQRLKSQLDRFLERLQHLRTEDAFREPDEPGRSSLSALLRTAIPSIETQRSFLDLYYAHEGPIEEFWTTKVPERLGWDQGQIRKVQTTLQYVALTSHHLPLIQRLQQREDIRSVRDLTKLERTDWLNLVKLDGRVSVPPEVPGKDDEEKAANYVDGMIGILQATFPTQFAAKVAARTADPSIGAVKSTLATFFERATNLPDEKEHFDFRSTPVHEFLAKHSDTVFAGIADDEKTKATVELKRMWRAFQMSPGPEQMQVLLENKLDSAYHITSVSQDHFVEQNAERLGGPEPAQKLYAKAEHITATLLNLYVDLNEKINHRAPSAVGNLGNPSPDERQELIKKIPNYSELFGALEMCECEHCRSVHSPAAYFVDVLQFLNPDPKNENPNIPKPKPIDVLLERRPDLEHIKLSCENTNTPMPYVDLVNEILEFYVAHNKLDKDAAKDTADSTAEELAANPQYAFTKEAEDAYTKLMKAVFPLSLPYNRDLDVARTYLEHLGSSRHQVMEIFKQSDTPTDRRRIEAEYLKISEKEYCILTEKNFDGSTPASPTPLHEYFGFDTEIKSTETVWVDDQPLPVGATPRGDGEGWTWVPTNPFSGTEAHQSAIAVGMHQHYFDSATQTLAIDAGDFVFTYVFLDPANVPEQVMLQWKVDTSWEHRVYWGANTDKIPREWGVNGTESRLPMGPLPAANTWVKLEVPASYVGLEGKQLNGIAFTLAGGRATWDKAGKRSANWQDQLTRVPEFLRRTGINYMELVELLKTRFINPDRDVFLQAPDASCDLTFTYIRRAAGGAPDDATLQRMLRFIRLWRKLGWSVQETDKAITALKTTDVTPTFIQQLAHTARLHADLKIPLVHLLNLWANIDTQGDDSLYAKMFLSRAALKLDPIFALHATGTELDAVVKNSANPPKIKTDKEDHTPAILAAFRLSEQDLTLLRVATDLDDKPDATPPVFATLNLANLSLLYRHVVLAKALKLPIKDLISLKTLSGIDPFDSPEQSSRFVALAHKVKQSGFAVARLNYLYCHIEEPSGNVAPSRESVLTLARTLRDGLTKIAEDNKLIPDTTGELTRTKLGQLFESAVVDQAMRLVNGTEVYTAPLASLPTLTLPPPSAGNKIFYDPTAKQLDSTGTVTLGEKALLLSLSDVSKYRSAVEELHENAKDGQTNTVKLDDDLPTLALVKMGNNRLVYDLKTLRLTGPLSSSERKLLESLSNDRPYQEALDKLSKQPSRFIEDALHGFLDSKDASENLLDRPSSPLQPLLTREQKFAYLLQRLLPVLRDKLSRSLIKQTVSEALALEANTTEFLLETALKSAENIKQAAIADFLLLGETGLSGVYFDDTTPDSDPNSPKIKLKRIDETVDFDWGTGSPDAKLAVDKFSARWTGMVLSQFSEDYTFYVRADDGVRLWIDDELLIDQWHDQLSVVEHTSTIKLKAGQLYRLRLEYYEQAGNAVVQLFWSSPSMPKAIIAKDQLSAANVAAIARTYTRLQKVALLISDFKLTHKELDYFGSHKADFADFDPNALPVRRDSRIPSQTDTDAVALFKQWERLYDFTALRNSLPQGEVGLPEVFGTAAHAADLITRLPSSPDNDMKKQQALDEAKKMLLAATRWDEKAVNALTGSGAFRLPVTPPPPPQGFNLNIEAFKNESWLATIQACLKLSKRMGIAVGRLFAWAKEPDPQQAQDIKNTVKAKYEDEQWLTVAKPLSDKLRESQKAALIDYLLTSSNLPKEVTDSNKLYEYFLIDVDMSACMKTSRIKQAISSVQLFIQRCLMNLEKEVSPSQIDARRWNTWMKRYRVWEANRKVFLYPENWIEPELRDDKSPFFKEMESELLQDDVTADTVEKAFLSYLYKLDQVGRLEICGMYWDHEANVLHAFGRTYSNPRLYFYRRLEKNGVWTPWEKLEVDIQGVEEGDHIGVHLIPVVWNRRLYLFWPVFAEAPDPRDDKKRILEIRLAWSEYNGGRWSPKHMTAERIESDYFRKGGHIFKGIVHPGDGSLRIVDIQYATILVPGSRYESGRSIPMTVIGSHGSLGVGVFQFGSCSQITHAASPQRIDFCSHMLSPKLLHPGPAYVEFSGFKQIPDDNRLVLIDSNFVELAPINELGQQGAIRWIPTLNAVPSRYELVYPHQVTQFGLSAPFFYQDKQRSYFVTTREKETVDFFGPTYFDPNRIEIEPPLLAKPPIITLPDLGDPSPLNMLSGAARSIGTLPVDTIEPQRKTAFDISRVGIDALTEVPWWSVDAYTLGFRPTTINVRFHTFFHPYVCEFIKDLNREGISGLLTTDNQRLRDVVHVLDVLGGGGFIPLELNIFKLLYSPTGHVDTPYPLENVDFSNTGAYALYNWELFFHAPMLLANRLSKNQRFEEAQRWYHYIFNPTDDTKSESSPARYWKVLPFKEPTSTRIDKLLATLRRSDDDPEKMELVSQIKDWRDNPFQPHRIARWRLGAYKKNVVMKYIDNLIAWGDQLFRQDTIESINEATQLYILAAEILGLRTQRVPPRSSVKSMTYSELKPSLDAFSQAWVEFEAFFPFANVSPMTRGGPNGTERGLGLMAPYFCIPQNDTLLGYWDTVADRLFKIRHCMNIEGIVRELPLFEPPIDVALLVQAAAMGVDLSSVLNDINGPTPYYRFQYMLQKALELCSDLKSLGAALLLALEKKDAEELASIRACHETVILKAVREVKEMQRDEAKAAKEGVEKSRATTCTRFSYYQRLLTGESASCPNPPVASSAVGQSHELKLSEHEKDHLHGLDMANKRQEDAA